jgi:hypothetical protein
MASLDIEENIFVPLLGNLDGGDFLKIVFAELRLRNWLGDF